MGVRSALWVQGEGPCLGPVLVVSNSRSQEHLDHEQAGQSLLLARGGTSCDHTPHWDSLNKVGGFDPCGPKQEQHLGTHVWGLRASVEFAVDATRVGISALSALSSGVPQVPQFQAMFAAGP